MRPCKRRSWPVAGADRRVLNARTALLHQASQPSGRMKARDDFLRKQARPSPFARAVPLQRPAFQHGIVCQRRLTCPRGAPDAAAGGRAGPHLVTGRRSSASGLRQMRRMRQDPDERRADELIRDIPDGGAFKGELRRGFAPRRAVAWQRRRFGEPPPTTRSAETRGLSAMPLERGHGAGVAPRPRESQMRAQVGRRCFSGAKSFSLRSWASIAAFMEGGLANSGSAVSSTSREPESLSAEADQGGPLPVAPRARAEILQRALEEPQADDVVSGTVASVRRCARWKSGRRARPVRGSAVLLSNPTSDQVPELNVEVGAVPAPAGMAS